MTNQTRSLSGGGLEAEVDARLARRRGVRQQIAGNRDHAVRSGRAIAIAHDGDVVEAIDQVVGGRLPRLLPRDDAERLAGLLVVDLQPEGQRDAEAQARGAQARRRLERDLDEAGGHPLARLGEAPAIEAVRLDVEVQAVEAVAVGRASG